MQAFGSNPPYAIFCDSLEVYDSDWTGDFLEEFQKRRGYDLKPHLPALVADMGPQDHSDAARLGKDADRVAERTLPGADAASGQSETGRSSEFRTTAFRPPRSRATPMRTCLKAKGCSGERLSSTRWASSASHLYGRPVASSETWTWLHSPSFRATPLDVKAEADLHFLQGINQLIGHGWPYTRRRRRVSRLAVLCGRRLQREESVVDRHAGRVEVSATRQLSDAPGSARQRRRVLSAQRRCLGPLYPRQSSLDRSACANVSGQT